MYEIQKSRSAPAAATTPSVTAGMRATPASSANVRAALARSVDRGVARATVSATATMPAASGPDWSLASGIVPVSVPMAKNQRARRPSRSATQRSANASEPRKIESRSLE